MAARDRGFSSGQRAQSQKHRTKKNAFNPPQRGFGLQPQPAPTFTNLPSDALVKNAVATPAAIPLQAKLTVGAANDPYEQEADKVARQVVAEMRSPEFQVRRGEEETVQPQRELPRFQVQARSQAGGSLEAPQEVEQGIAQARGKGQPLNDSVREPMERAFGASFGGVRVHTDGQADQLNQSIQAKAFTTGQDVFFRAGAYQPGSQGGQELLAHELTHVVQQKEIIQRTSNECIPTLKRAEYSNSTSAEEGVDSARYQFSSHKVLKLLQRDEEIGNTDLRIQQGPSCWLTVIESMLKAEGKKTSTLALILSMYEKKEKIEEWTTDNPDKTQDMHGYTAPITKNLKNINDILKRLKNYKNNGETQNNANQYITKSKLQDLLHRVSASVESSESAFEYKQDKVLVNDVIAVYQKAEVMLNKMLNDMGNVSWLNQVNQIMNIPYTALDGKSSWSDFVSTIKNAVKLPCWVGISQGIKGKNLPNKDTDFRGTNDWKLEKNNHALMLIGYGADNKGKYVKYKNPNRGNPEYTVAYKQFVQFAGSGDIQLFSFKQGLKGAENLIDQPG